MTATTTVALNDSHYLWHDAKMLCVIGANSADFLQGYVTCDTSRLGKDSALPMAICNVKGRTLASGWLVPIDQGIGLVVHASVIESVQAFLLPYITFSKCELANPPIQPVWLSTESLGVQLNEKLHISSPIEPQTPPEDCSQAMQQWLIETQFAFVSDPLAGKFLPQMLALEQVGAVDFDKGCYLGQEIVARAQFRGAIKRQLTPFTKLSPTPTAGDVLPNGNVVVAVDEQGNGLAVSKI